MSYLLCDISYGYAKIVNSSNNLMVLMNNAVSDLVTLFSKRHFSCQSKTKHDWNQCSTIFLNLLLYIFIRIRTTIKRIYRSWHYTR